MLALPADLQVGVGGVGEAERDVVSRDDALVVEVSQRALVK